MNTKGIGGHEKSYPITNDWQTPPHIVKAVGPFDLDPCASLHQVTPTAKEMWTIEDGNSLFRVWGKELFIWLNPPYERDSIAAWMRRMADHANGIACVFARTETRWFQDHVFGSADGIFFLDGRPRFIGSNLKPAKRGCGGAIVLIAYGIKAGNRLRTCELPGRYVDL